MQALENSLKHSNQAAGRFSSGPEGPVWVEDSCAGSLGNAALQTALRGALEASLAHRRAPRALADAAVVVVFPSPHEAEGEETAAQVKNLKRAAPDAAVVVMAESASLQLARSALRAGARGMVHAGMPPEQIAHALSVAERGGVVLPRELLDEARAEVRGADLAALTKGQLRNLRLVAEGLTNAEIAQRLWISESTVKQHLRHVYKHLGVRSRQQAAAVFRRSAPFLHSSRSSSVRERGLSAGPS